MAPRPEEIHLASNRLSIVPFSGSDADDAFRCITPSLTRFMSWDPPANREIFSEIWQSWLPTIDAGTDYVFSVRQRHDDSFLGLAGLHHVRKTSAELGIWILEERQNEGFGREAVSLVVGWASRNIGIASFIYPVAEENYSSRRIAECLGGVIVERQETPKYKRVIYRIPSQPVREDA